MEVIKRRKGTVYREMIYIDGLCVKSPTFTRKGDAKAWKSKMLHERQQLELNGLEYKKKEQIRFKEYALAWLEKKIRVQKSQSTYNTYKRNLKLHFFPVVGKVYMHHIKAAHADKIIENLMTTGHNENGVNKIMQTFRTILLDAENNDFISKTPMRNYPILKVKKLPASFWSINDIRQFLQANIHDEHYHLYVVALNTGMRKGELAGLCWDRVDFQRRMIEVSRIRDRYGSRNTTKSGRARHVPMNNVVLATLTRLHQMRRNEFVFIRENGDPVAVQHLYRYFKMAQEKAQMELKIRFHDLRHTFASHFMMSGGNLYDLQKILGHSKYEMTQIYAHLSPAHLADTTQILSFGGESVNNMSNVKSIV